jgi:hypothetical protein
MKGGSGDERKGVGLYTYEQVKNTSPFQYFAQIVVGMIVAATGGLFLYHEAVVRTEEVQRYGSAETHVWGWLGGLAIVMIGLFMAHAGLVFYGRRIVGAFSRKPSHSNGSKHHGRG